jgi:hypothetical protein
VREGRKELKIVDRQPLYTLLLGFGHPVMLVGLGNSDFGTDKSYIVRYMMFSKLVDRGPIKMVQHRVIYAPERKNPTIVKIKTPAITLIKNTSVIKRLLTLFTADPPSSHLNWLFFFFFLHVVPVFTGLQLPILPPLRQDGPGLIPSLSTGSSFPWIQATARFHVGHIYM